MLTNVLKDIEVVKNSIIIAESYPITFQEKTKANIIEKVDSFVVEMMKKNQSGKYYCDKRKAAKPDVDIRTGKYGEYVACAFLEKLCGFPKGLRPENDIRTGTEKGWECDLPYNKLDKDYPNVHVKTCGPNIKKMMKKYRNDLYSWTFQWEDETGHGRDILFRGKCENDLIALVYVDLDIVGEDKVVAIAPWRKAKKLLCEPIMDRLKPIKKCLDYKDVLDNALFIYEEKTVDTTRI